MSLEQIEQDNHAVPDDEETRENMVEETEQVDSREELPQMDEETEEE